MDWTDKQLLAIDTPGKNLLVSAAAGSGKTAVLTERILRLVIKDEVPLKELLVVTFTDAAASEMRARIAGALAKVAGENSIAEKQLMQLGTAKIITFHSFCLSILRKYFYIINLDPSFSVADEKRAEAIKEEALDEVLSAAFSDDDEEFQSAFIDFLMTYSDVRDERKIRSRILKAYEFIMTLPNPLEWLAGSVTALSVPPKLLAESAAIKFSREEVRHMLEIARTLTENTGMLLAEHQVNGLALKNSMDLERIKQIEKKYSDSDMDAVRDALYDNKFEIFAASGSDKEKYASLKDYITERRLRVKGIIKDIRENYFARSESDYSEEIAHIAPYARMLETLVKRFFEKYSEIKRTEKLIDFSDYEHFALKILEDDSIADDYRERLKYIFIDEYQDSNYVQEELIRRIARPDNLFMVGDVKQSIYSWRNAAPEIFLEKQRRFSPEDDGTLNKRIDLSKNFRSKLPIIEAVNVVFTDIMEKHYSGMDYDEDARLELGLEYPPEADKKVFLHLVQKDVKREEYDTDAEGEALLCAETIKEMVGKEEIFDVKSKTLRKVKFGDIAILMKTAKRTAEIYRKTIEACGIPVVTDKGEGFFETIEVETFIGLLRAVVNLRRDVPLAAAMCSTVFGFELSELAEIREDRPGGFFHSAFLAYAEDGEDKDLQGKCKNMIGKLASWRDEERFMRLDDFLWKLMRESGFYNYVGRLTHGNRRQANLRALLDRAASFQSGRIEGLRGFIGFLDRIKVMGGAPQVSLVTGEEDVCRIMTIHGSKGLEFPVVFLGGLGKGLRGGGGYGSDELMLDRDLGLSMLWRDQKSNTYKTTLLHAAFKTKADIIDRAEDIRLLYVGMTRAMDRLHLIGTLKNPFKDAARQLISEGPPGVETDILGAANYLQLIMPAIFNHPELFDARIELPTSEKAGKGYIVKQDPEEKAETSPYTYPHSASSKLKSKYSVTELGKIHQKEQPQTFFTAGSRDEMDEDAGLTAAEKGTALHKALELMDFPEAYNHREDKNWFKDYVSKLQEDKSLNKAEAESVDEKTLMLFAGTQLAARAAAAGFVMKEAPFNMKLPYSEAAAERDGFDGEDIVVQGVIDCLFREENGLVIVDYKSSSFNASAYESEAERIRSIYGPQLRLYRRAAELIFGEPVKETLIYMSRSGVTIDIP